MKGHLATVIILKRNIRRSYYLAMRKITSINRMKRKITMIMMRKSIKMRKNTTKKKMSRSSRQLRSRSLCHSSKQCHFNPQ